jgi:Xaa-Pro aminopeptidase
MDQLDNISIQSGIQEFPEEEYQERYQKCRNLMQDHEIDVLVISDQMNCRYFTGFKGRTFHRPAFFVLPIEEQPILIVASDFGAQDARSMSWIKKIITYDFPITHNAIGKAIMGLAKKPKKIGMEIDDTFFGGFRPALSYGMFKRLIDEYKDVGFCDASRLIWQIRMIKTKREIDCIRRAGTILKESYSSLFSNIHAGMTEEEIAASFVQEMVKNGADLPNIGQHGPSAMIIMNASRPTESPNIPTNKTLIKGDLLRIDCGAIFKGYYTDFACSGIVGEPSQEQLVQWNKVVESVTTEMEKLKPGIKGDEINIHWHGVGIYYVEAPFRGTVGKGIPRGTIMENTHGDLEIQAGMTLALEDIIVSTEGDTFHFEEVVEITETGYNNLSHAHREFFKIK